MAVQDEQKEEEELSRGLSMWFLATSWKPFHNFNIGRRFCGLFRHIEFFPLLNNTQLTGGLAERLNYPQQPSMPRLKAGSALWFSLLIESLPGSKEAPRIPFPASLLFPLLASSPRSWGPSVLMGAGGTYSATSRRKSRLKKWLQMFPAQ